MMGIPCRNRQVLTAILSFEIQLRVGHWKWTDVSEEHFASLFLQNVSWFSTDDTSWYPRRWEHCLVNYPVLLIVSCVSLVWCMIHQLITIRQGMAVSCSEACTQTMVARSMSGMDTLQTVHREEVTWLTRKYTRRKSDDGKLKWNGWWTFNSIIKPQGDSWFIFFGNNWKSWVSEK